MISNPEWREILPEYDSVDPCPHGLPKNGEFPCPACFRKNIDEAMINAAAMTKKNMKQTACTCPNYPEQVDLGCLVHFFFD